MKEISKLYEQYLAFTENPQAAATLVLAHVTDAKQRVPVPDAPLTVAQAANALNVSDDTIYQLCSNGHLRHQRIGVGRGTIRIRREDLGRIEQESTHEEDDGLALFRRHCSGA